MPIYMKMAGIDGNVTATKYEKWIEVNSVSFGIGRGIGSATGKASDREASAPSLSEVSIAKTADISSIKLFETALYGEGIHVDIHLCKTDKGDVEPYIKYELINTLISGFSVSSGGDRPSESISLNFTAINFTYTPMGSLNETGEPVTTGYDMTKIAQKGK
jgi:type VI secretion system secreted protein Hcp